MRPLDGMSARSSELAATARAAESIETVGENAQADAPDAPAAAPTAQERSHAWKAHSSDSTASGIQSALAQKLQAALAKQAGRAGLNPTAKAAIARAQGQQRTRVQLPEKPSENINAPARGQLGKMAPPGEDYRIGAALDGMRSDPMREMAGGAGRAGLGLDPHIPGLVGGGTAGRLGGLGDGPPRLGSGGAPDLGSHGGSPEQHRVGGGRFSPISSGANPHLAAGGGSSIAEQLGRRVAGAKAASQNRPATGALSPPLSDVQLGVKQIMQQLDIGGGAADDHDFGATIQGEAQEKFPGDDAESALKRAEYCAQRGVEPTETDQNTIDQSPGETEPAPEPAPEEPAPAPAPEPAPEEPAPAPAPEPAPEEPTPEPAPEPAPEGGIGDTKDKTPNPEEDDGMGHLLPFIRERRKAGMPAMIQAARKRVGRESLENPGRDGGFGGADAQTLGAGGSVHDIGDQILTDNAGEPETSGDVEIEDRREWIMGSGGTTTAGSAGPKGTGGGPPAGGVTDTGSSGGDGTTPPV